MFVTPGRYVSHQTRYVMVPTIIVMLVAGQRVYWRWEDEGKPRKATLAWTKVAMKSGQYLKEGPLKNRGLLSRAYKELDTPYRLPDEGWLLACIARAKRELGPRQVTKHDKWTARVVRLAVSLYREEA